MKTKQNILFRFSGGKADNKELGFGHVYRCLNLAKSLKEHNLFFIIEDYGGVEKIINEAGFSQIFRLSNNIKQKSDVEKTIKIIKEKSIDKVIVDKYKIKISYLKKIKKFTKIIFISDLKKIDFPVDLVINGFIGLDETIKKNKFNVPVLAGIKYQIIDKKFQTVTKSSKKFKLVTSFGGFDEHGISNIVINEIIKLKPKFKTKIILGPGTKNFRKITNEERKFISIIKKTRDMKKEISSAEIGLCSGGLTSYEFVSQKMPFGIICQEKHQIETAIEWEKQKMAINLGIINEETNQKVQVFLEEINNIKKSTKLRRICDGRGSERVSKAILNLK